MIRVENERHIEGARGQTAWPLAAQHVQEIRGVAEHRIGLNRTAAGVQPAKRGDDRTELRRQTDRSALVALR